MHGSIKQLRKTNLSAVTNGVRPFADRLDLRTPRGRRWKDLLFSYTKAIGTPSEAQRAIIRDLALMQLISEDLQQAYMEDGEIDQAQYFRVVNAMRKHMSALGLIRRAGDKPHADDEDGDDGLDPLEYVRGGSRKRSRLTDDEEED